jgi:hypothetical protein
VGSETSRKSCSTRRGLAAARVVAAVLVLLAAAVCLACRQEPDPGRRAPRATVSAPPPTSSPARSRSLPLRGVPLRAPTNLRLLVADAPAPFVLDVDQETIQPITGLPEDGDRGVSVAALGEDALVLSQRFCGACRPVDSVYVVRRGSTAATRLGRSIGAVTRATATVSGRSAGGPRTGARSARSTSTAACDGGRGRSAAEPA